MGTALIREAYTSPQAGRGVVTTKRLPTKPVIADVPPYPLFRLIVSNWDEIVRDVPSSYCSESAESMSFCEHVAEAIYEWLARREDRLGQLLDESGRPIIGGAWGMEGLWAGDPGLRHVWLEAWVPEPGDEEKTHRWVIDPTANQFAVDQTHGYNDPRPLVIMPTSSPRYRRFYRNREQLDQFNPF